MSFASLKQPAIPRLIERFATAADLTLLVGAGASIESGLPSWRDLIERLLTEVARHDRGLLGAEQKRQWVQRTLEREDLLGAGAVIEVMKPKPLEQLVPDQLYGPSGPAGYLPGPTAHQVAALKGVYGERLDILTTNYDDLIEGAIAAAGTPPSRIRSYRGFRSPSNRAAGTVAVTHLHGIAGRREPARDIVLTEEHYHRMQRASSWQERFVTGRLRRSHCLFVGMGLSDPNLVRYLYGYGPSDPPRHAAIFVRQGEPECPPEVRAGLERAAAKRWARCGVQAIFVDHFADAAQLLYEIGYRRRSGKAYEPLAERACATIESAERGLGASGGGGEFGRRQVALSSGLRSLLTSLLRSALGPRGRLPSGEQLALGFWLLTPDGTGLTAWLHSDRAHQDPRTVFPVPVLAATDWVAVRTVCSGVRVELDRDIYASRWRFVRGLPLVIDSPARLPIGCLTIASTKPGAESVLTRIPEKARAAFHEGLQDAGRSLFELLTLAGASA